MKRTPLVVGNWKMQLSPKLSLSVAKDIKSALAGKKLSVDMVICPSFTALAPVAELCSGGPLQVGAQNIHWIERGAWTGQVSATDIKPYAKWCIIGHSETRAITQETDEHIGAKAAALIRHSITPVICIGETSDERQREETMQKIAHQMEQILQSVLPQNVPKIVFAYEPIWAISTNKPTDPPTPEMIVEIVLFIRKKLTSSIGHDAANLVRIIYGGSVTEQNVSAIVSEPTLDGVLPGSASQRPHEYAAIARAVAAHS